MEKPVELRDKNTGMLEIKKIVDCLTKNGYEFEGIKEVYRYPNDFIADFSKKIDYTDAVGEYIPDSSLKVSIQFEKHTDYKNIEKNEDLEEVYIGDPNEFIQSIIDSTRKQPRKRRTRKTRSL